MKPTHTHKTLMALLLLLLLSGCVFNQPRAKTVLQVTEPHMPGSALVIQTHNGSVDVQADDSLADVQITVAFTCVGATQGEADQRVAAASLSLTRDTGRTLTIKPIFPGGRQGGDSASIIVRLPDANGVTIDTSNGGVKAIGLSGRLFADTSNGAIVVSRHAGNVEVDTSNGSVTIDDVDGDILVDTSNGGVRASNIAGSAVIDTSNGSITLVLAPDQVGPIELTTSNGGVRATVGGAFQGEVEITTSNGNITLRDHADIITMRELTGRRAQFTAGSGGAASRIHTSNGRAEFTIEKP